MNKKMNKYIEIWLSINVSTSVKVNEKNFENFGCKQDGGAESIANKSVLMAAEPLPVEILHLEEKNEKDSENIYKNKWASWDFFEFSIFRKMASKNCFRKQFFLLKLMPFFE